jgi:LmbE family N-acetylglucosaminyl deacetylase
MKASSAAKKLLSALSLRWFQQLDFGALKLWTVLTSKDCSFMINLSLGFLKDRPLKILCLGAHSDDIEIGCGGAVLRFIHDHPGVRFHWVVFSAIGVRKVEAQRSAELFAGSNLESLQLNEFRDGFMPFNGSEVKDVFEKLKQEISPDLIFTHQPCDAHQDHRLLSELTWNTFRNDLILEYEIPKYDGDMGRPSVFVPLDSEICQTKVRHLLDAFQSQRTKAWFEESTFNSLMRLRGMECNAPSGYAEAFYCRKLMI